MCCFQEALVMCILLFLILPVEFLFCDLASMKSIRKCVQNFKAKNIGLHVLINNGKSFNIFSLFLAKSLG